MDLIIFSVSDDAAGRVNANPVNEKIYLHWGIIV
jgi:hypothetical protein